MLQCSQCYQDYCSVQDFRISKMATKMETKNQTNAALERTIYPAKKQTTKQANKTGTQTSEQTNKTKQNKTIQCNTRQNKTKQKSEIKQGQNYKTNTNKIKAALTIAWTPGGASGGRPLAPATSWPSPSPPPSPVQPSPAALCAEPLCSSLSTIRGTYRRQNR